jgi:N,N-dimethylformamidase
MASVYDTEDTMIEADLVQLTGKGEDAVIAVPSTFAGSRPGSRQDVVTGSFVELPPGLDFRSFTLRLSAWPTLPSNGSRQMLFDQSLGAKGLRLFLDEAGHLVLMLDETSLALPTPLMRRRWWQITARYEAASGKLFLGAVPRQIGPADAVLLRPMQVSANIGSNWCALSVSACLAGSCQARGTECYNGKLERPIILSSFLEDEGELTVLTPADPAVLGWWDFSASIGSESIADLSSHARHGRAINMPTSAVTGEVWDGSCHDWRASPDHYGALHFHEDDLIDANWQPTIDWNVPHDLPSGIYALRLKHAGDVDLSPFFVRAEQGNRADVLFLASTATYIAYGNSRLFHEPGMFGPEGKADNSNDATLRAHPEFGLSTYEHHRDGSGVHHASRLRPIMNMKPGGLSWSLEADLQIVDWLNRSKPRFDVATDEDLHDHGIELLAEYRVIVTGTHPEYFSTAMRNALEDWLNHGGRLMYMGANGIYWRIAFCPERKGIIEVRRAEDGTRAWAEEPGQFFHAFSGEYGGLWRRQGHDKTPNTLLGVGFAAQGFFGGAPYSLMPGSADPRVAFLFEGVTSQKIIADGEIGAANEELDRFDPRLGSPKHGVVVARSKHAPGEMLRTKEEMLVTMPVYDDPDIRADLTFFETASGGAVFSTGSIGFAAALGGSEETSDIARIADNALRRFLDPRPFLPDGEHYNAKRNNC